MSTSLEPRLYACASCKTGAGACVSTSAPDPRCPACAAPLLPLPEATAVFRGSGAPMDETMTAYLAAPLPEEVMARAGNPANLFGKYVFLREIGRGSTGSVLKAWDTYLSRHVALKFLHAASPRNVEIGATERVQDFLREARIAARLRHPNIVPVHEVDFRDGRYYISMDFIHGGTLSDLIHGPADARVRTRFYAQPRRLLGLLRTIAIAVHYAHTQIPPVVHRDLKPQNVLIDAAGQPFVADFGLANEVRVDAADGRTEGVRGTPAYMAPEQALAQAHEIDARTDVYSLGVILYEMLAGEPPFSGSNIPSVLRKIVTDPPSPPSGHVSSSADFTECPRRMRERLDGVCLKALSKRKENRYPTALDFADAVQECVELASTAPPTPKSSSGFPRRRRPAVIVAAAAVLLALGVAAAGARRSLPAGPAPGDDVVIVAAGLLSEGKWSACRATVAELRRRAPGHPQLPALERALADRAAFAEQRRSEWAGALDALDPDDLRRRLDEVPEDQGELRARLQTTLDRRSGALLEEARRLAAGAPRETWLTTDVRTKASALETRIAAVERAAADPALAVRPGSLDEARRALARILTYRGEWSLRINVVPFAEFRILQGSREQASEATPALVRSLEIGDGETTLEVAWPSLAEPKVRWTRTLADLKPGETVVVSGDIEQSRIEVRRP